MPPSEVTKVAPASSGAAKRKPDALEKPSKAAKTDAPELKEESPPVEGSVQVHFAEHTHVTAAVEQESSTLVSSSVSTLTVSAVLPSSTSLAVAATEQKGAPKALFFQQEKGEWENWSQNLQNTALHYYRPKTRSELAGIVAQTAGQSGVVLRVSGQRHSQPPLVMNDKLTPSTKKTVLVDMACYADLGDPANPDRYILESTGGNFNRVTVNTGVREDTLAQWLALKGYMLNTVTAGGFFSIGGMTSVDVHGSNTASPIFAEQAVAFNIMGPDGVVRLINTFPELNYARVNLGALGIVTSVTLNISPLALNPSFKKIPFIGIKWYDLPSADAFVQKFKADILPVAPILEVFFDPYKQRYMPLGWNNAQPTTSTQPVVDNACANSAKGPYGAPYENPFIEPIAQGVATNYQVYNSTLEAPFVRGALMKAALCTISDAYIAAGDLKTDLWLTKAARVIFMSYFIPIAGLNDQGLQTTWQGLNLVSQLVNSSNAQFWLVAPMEFRFVRGGSSNMAGTFSTSPNSMFVNLDMIAFVDEGSATAYPPQLLQFFAAVERGWIDMGGRPHNGKIYGFFDPTVPNSATPPFNPNFLKWHAKTRQAQTQPFNAYRKSVDPNGLFSNDYVDALFG